jgi:hypothetical protein
MSEEYLKNPEVIHLQKLVRIETNSLGRRVKRLEGRADKFHARLDKLESHPAGEPPTGDPASQPDSNTENPGRLVPIWVREYVEWKIDQRLGRILNEWERLDKPPLTSRADSEIPERGKWRVGSKVKLNVYEGDRPVCQCHSFIDADLIVTAMNRQEPAINATLENVREIATRHGWNGRGYLSVWLDEQLGGPPTPDLAAQPDSTPKDPSGHFTESYKVPHFPPIGVHDYDSLVVCLRSNFQQVFFQHAETDPQDMIQIMAAEILTLRRHNDDLTQNA